MKFFKILQIILGLLVISCQQKNEYQISGNVQDIPDSTIIDLFLQYENIGIRKSSDTIFNGVFSFSDSIGNEILQMSLMLRDRQNFYGSCDIWVGKSEIRVSGKGKYLSQWTVSSNLEEQIAQNFLSDQTRDLRRIRDSLLLTRAIQQDYNKNQKKLDSINYFIFEKELAHLQNNYNSLPGIIALYNISQFTDSTKLATIKKIIDKVDTVYANTLYGQGIRNSLKKYAPVDVGDRFIDFYAHDLNGNSHRISEFNDKYILLDFWSLACYPCILAAPEIREASEKFKNELNIIGVNLDTRKNLWEEASRRDSITWINLSDGKGTFGGAYHVYGINGFPTYILIDTNGVIIDKWMGYSAGSFNEKLSKYLKQDQR